MAIIESGAAIDLLFTDVVMPGAFGAPELARRAQRRLPGLRVLFTSGYTDNAIIHGGHFEEGVELLSKPFTQDELARKLRSARRAPPPRACDGIFRRRRIEAVWADAAGTGSHGARARSSYRAADGREIIRQVMRWVRDAGFHEMLGGFRPGVAIFSHRRGCAALERGGARSADSFGRHEPDQPVAALADCVDALALHVLKEGVLLRAIDLPEAEIVLVLDGHFSVLSWRWRRGRERRLVGQCSPVERSSSTAMRTRRSIAPLSMGTASPIGLEILQLEADTEEQERGDRLGPLGSHGAQDHETPAFPIRASEPGRGPVGISRLAVVARQQPTSPRPTPGDKRFPVSSGPSRPPQRTKCRERASQTAERTKERWVNRLRLPSAYRLSKRALSQTRLHTRFAAVNESVRAILR